MKFIIALFLSSAFFLTSCSVGSNNDQNNLNDSLRTVHEKNISDSLNQNQDFLCTGWYYVLDDSGGVVKKLDKAQDVFFIDPTPIVTAKHIATFEFYEANDVEKSTCLAMQLNEKGTEDWSKATGNSINKKLAFIIDNKLVYVPTVQSQVDRGATALCRFIYSRAEVEAFKKIIEWEQ